MQWLELPSSNQNSQHLVHFISLATEEHVFTQSEDAKKMAEVK